MTTPVTLSAATATPVIEIKMRPGMPRMRLECRGNCAVNRSGCGAQGGGEARTRVAEFPQGGKQIEEN